MCLLNPLPLIYRYIDAYFGASRSRIRPTVLHHGRRLDQIRANLAIKLEEKGAQADCGERLPFKCNCRFECPIDELGQKDEA